MGMIFGLLGGLAGLASFVCFIMVLIKLIQHKGPLHGILGIISCGIYTFIYGWMNVEKFHNRNIMPAWTAAIIAGFVFKVLGGFLSSR